MISTMTLTEMLEHMQELANSGMENSEAFTTANNEYHRAVGEIKNAKEISGAIIFLSENSVGSLNVDNMIETLKSLQ
jgi:hypothetical protein